MNTESILDNRPAMKMLLPKEENAPSKMKKWREFFYRIITSFFQKKKICFVKNGLSLLSTSYSFLFRGRQFIVMHISSRGPAAETCYDKQLLQIKHEQIQHSIAEEEEGNIVFLAPQINLKLPSQLQIRPEYRERDPLAGGEKSMRFYQILNMPRLDEAKRYKCEIVSSFPTVEQIRSNPETVQRNQKGYLFLHVNATCIEEYEYGGSKLDRSLAQEWQRDCLSC